MATTLRAFLRDAAEDIVRRKILFMSFLGKGGIVSDAAGFCGGCIYIQVSQRIIVRRKSIEEMLKPTFSGSDACHYGYGIKISQRFVCDLAGSGLMQSNAEVFLNPMVGAI